MRSGGLNSSVSNAGPLHHPNNAVHTNLGATRPLYGLSAVFQVAADTTPPTLTSAEVDGTGNSIDLQFSENVEVQPAPCHRLHGHGRRQCRHGLQRPCAGERTATERLWLQLSTAITQGQAVVVSYTDPTTGDDASAIQDAAGNDALSFTTGMHGVPAVTNASTVVPPRSPRTGASSPPA